MAGIKINFSEVEGGFEPLPEGSYEVIIERVEVRESNSSDNDYLNWEFKVTEDDFEERRLWMITSLSPKALFRLKDNFLALGVLEEDEDMELEWEDDIDITPKEGPRLIEPELEGLACTVTVGNEVYEGRERNKVVDLQAADAPKPRAGAKKAGSKTATKPKAGAKAGGRRKLR